MQILRAARVLHVGGSTLKFLAAAHNMILAVATLQGDVGRAYYPCAMGYFGYSRAFHIVAISGIKYRDKLSCRKSDDYVMESQPLAHIRYAFRVFMQHSMMLTIISSPKNPKEHCNSPVDPTYMVQTEIASRGYISCFSNN
ncbi:hypothetical protein QCA50_020247 [Cerrena zonata]|uniref:Uncharacterized protein n=1 Tax=Cerrena zonata TaxID=2478898 RepID=A0AAW0FF80_9APHY